MIYEFAVDPALLATLSRREHRATCALIVQGLQPDAGRVPSWFPTRWREMALRAIDGLDDMEKQRLTTLVEALSRAHTARPDYHWRQDGAWLPSALDEHRRMPFRGILVAEAEPWTDPVLTVEALLSDTAAHWRTQPAVLVPRRGDSMADAVATLLACTRKIAFVDPYFDPTQQRYRRSFGAFMRYAERWRSRLFVPGIELHTRRSDPDVEVTELQRQWSAALGGILPAGWGMDVFLWKEKPGRWRLHNRYVLTELGGAEFGCGLDEGPPGTEDTVARLSEEAVRRLFGGYRAGTDEFGADGRFMVRGACRT